MSSYCYSGNYPTKAALLLFSEHLPTGTFSVTSVIQLAASSPVPGIPNLFFTSEWLSFYCDVRKYLWKLAWILILAGYIFWQTLFNGFVIGRRTGNIWKSKKCRCNNKNNPSLLLNSSMYIAEVTLCRMVLNKATSYTAWGKKDIGCSLLPRSKGRERSFLILFWVQSVSILNNWI